MYVGRGVRCALYDFDGLVGSLEVISEYRADCMMRDGMIMAGSYMYLLRIYLSALTTFCSSDLDLSKAIYAFGPLRV